MKLSCNQWKIFNEVDKFYLCKKPFTDRKYNNFGDYDHMTGQFTCNLNANYQKYIPIFFHNLSNYDAHLFVKEFS